MGVLIDPVDPNKLALVAAGLQQLTHAEYRVLKGLLKGGWFAEVATALGLVGKSELLGGDPRTKKPRLFHLDG